MSRRLCPSTPTRDRETSPAIVDDPVREYFDRLNQIFNLGLRLPDTPLSPAVKDQRAKCDANFGRQDRIASLVRYFHYQDPFRLHAVLDTFEGRAREESTSWVRKPQADQTLLPRPGEQVKLQGLLLTVLEESKSDFKIRQGQNAVGAASAASDGSGGRYSTVGMSRMRGNPLAGYVLQTVEQDGVHDVQDVHDIQPRARSDTLSTVSDSGSSAQFYDSFETPATEFDGDDDDGNDDEAGEQTFLRRSLSQESFPASEGEMDALNESFNLFNVGDGEQSDDDLIKKEDDGEIRIPEMASLHISRRGMADTRDNSTATTTATTTQFKPDPKLWDRLTSVFPATPAWLQQAPFAIIWELTRFSLRCGVDLESIQMSCSEEWWKQDVFLDVVSKHPAFSGRLLPERSSQISWDLALRRDSCCEKKKMGAVFSASLEFTTLADGPVYRVKLLPISHGQTYRLARHYGAHRFIELLFPSHNSKDKDVQTVNHWLATHRHDFVGRHWASFFIKNVDSKKQAASKWDNFAEKKPSGLSIKRVFLFAEKGSGQHDTSASLPPIPVHDMLDWLLQFDNNENKKQPYLKLFSRIALGLTRTTPTVVFESHQIIHEPDIEAEQSKKVMNDGIGTMSLSVVRKLRSDLDLTDLPTAVQGRLGSAKGMWILDPTDDGKEDWIRLYASQKKWECDFLDADHRTLEVRNYASEARPAGLTMQFLPILEDRAIDKKKMRRVIGDIFRGHLIRDLETQKQAMENTLSFSMWTHENSSFRAERSSQCQVPFLGGLPDRNEDAVQFLVQGGFDPRQQQYLWKMVYDMQKQKCEKLRDKLNIKVGRAVNLHMVVDFLGVLEEGEVQVCFSSKYQVEADSAPDETGDDGSFSDTLLIDRDVLVARSPAHFPSDIQRVRCVFKRQLCMLKDVIVFSRKGEHPLADKLSGGDYDGDIAWVCWDPRIVNNFENAPLPHKYDFVKEGYMRKVKDSLNDLVQEQPAGRGARAKGRLLPTATGKMVERSFEFSMRDDLLSRLTVYKERLCYLRGKIGDRTGLILSSLLSDLVDQAKQGTIFTAQDFNRLRKDCLEGDQPGRPLLGFPRLPKYKNKNVRWRKGEPAENIIDELKFVVAKPLIEQELKALDAFKKGGSHNKGPNYWDEDLAKPAKEFEVLAHSSPICQAILQELKSDIDAVRIAWADSTQDWMRANSPSKGKKGSPSQGGESDAAAEDPGYRQRVLDVYQQWMDIRVRLPAEAGRNGTVVIKREDERCSEDKKDSAAEVVRALLQQEYLADVDYSQWAILRASQTYLQLYGQSHKSDLLWRLAGRQLQAIKALMTSGRRHNGGGGGSSILMTPMHYAASRPDNKIVTHMVARLRKEEDDGTLFDYEDESD